MLRIVRNRVPIRSFLSSRVIRIEENGEKVPTGETNAESENTAELKQKYQELSKKYEEKDTRIKELQDAYLQMVADMENLRNRTKKEVENSSLFAVQKFSKDLLTVADTLEMAIHSVPADQLKHPENHSLRDLHEGVTLTLTELMKCFKRHGIEHSDPHLEKFDPNLHSAILEIPSHEHEPGTIVLVQKKGYTLNGRIIRPPNVGVAKKADHHHHHHHHHNCSHHHHEKK